MDYIALFEYTEYGDVRAENQEARSEGRALFQAVVSAQNADDAESKFRDLLIQLHKESEIFFDVTEIFLHSFAELNTFPHQATPLQWISFRPFGDKSSSISTILTNDKTPINFYGFAASPETENDDEATYAEPFIVFADERRPECPLYKSLLRRKERGEKLIFKELSDGDLYTLFVIEDLLNKQIADLFDVNPSTVTSRRKKVDATMDEVVMHSLLNDQSFIDKMTRLMETPDSE